MVLRQKQGPELLPVFPGRMYQEFLENEEFWFMGLFLTGRSVAWAEHWWSED